MFVQFTSQVRRSIRAFILLMGVVLVGGCGSGGQDPGLQEAATGKAVLAVSSQLYLHGTAAAANPAVLFLDKNAPTANNPKFKDSPNLESSSGDSWKEIGVWQAAPSVTVGDLIGLQELHVWLGLQNSGQGLKFDLRAEVLRNGTVLATGERFQITGLKRSPNQTQEVTVSLSSPAGNFDGSSDQLGLRVLARISPNSGGDQGAGHSSYTGLRLYFDSATMPSRFGTTQNTGPLAVAHALPGSGTAPLEVAFDAIGSTDPDGTIIMWEWDLLGNGNFQDYSMTTGAASFTFVNGGTYQPVLRVTDDSGATDTVSLMIDVNAAPVASASASPDAGFPPMLVQFDGSLSADTDGAIETFEWDFGEGNGFENFGSTPTAMHNYTAIGNYTAVLRVTDNDGATATAAVSINTTIPPPNQLPIADGSVTPVSGTQPLQVAFDGSASSDPDGSIVMWEWDLGDGSGFNDYSMTQGVLQFTYIDAGDKTAVLRVTDDENDVDTQSFSIHVNAQPDAIGDAVPGSGNAPLDAQFSASGSSDSDGSIIQWEWDFGEGGGFADYSGSMGSASHIYNSPGSYIAILRVTDDEGGQAIFNQPIFVNSPPSAALSADPLSGFYPLLVEFDAGASSDADNDIILYEWDFDGNGSFDVELPADLSPDQASYNYSTAGIFNAMVRVTDSYGAQDTASVAITVSEPPSGEWVHTIGFSGMDSARGTAVDADGNVYVAGYSSGGGYGGKDVLVAKYNSAGLLQNGWPMRWGGSGDDEAIDIEVDAVTGNLVVAGITNSFPFGDTGGNDLFAFRMTPDGDLLWQRTVGTPGTENTTGQCIAFDSGGDVYLGCTTTIDGTDTAICKLDGSNGNLFWHRLIGNQTGHVFGALRATSSGLYVFGTRADGAPYPWNNLFLIKMNRSDGGGIWQKQLQIAGDHFSEAQALDVAMISGTERVYATAAIVVGEWDGYLFTVAGDGSGTVTGTRWSGPANQFFRGVDVDNSGNVVVSANGNGASMYLFKFDSNLGFLAGERWDGTASGEAGQVAIHPEDQHAVVVGTAANNSGAWTEYTPQLSDGSSAYLDNTAIVPSFMNYRTPSGSLVFAGGSVQDTGAGSGEMFVAKRDIGNFPPNQPPVAFLSADPQSGSAPLAVNFDASLSYDPDGSIVKFEWDWDNNGSYDYDSGTDPTVVHAYLSPGSFEAEVRVTDNRNDTATDSINIVVSPPDWTHSWGSSQNEILHDLALAGSDLVSAGESNSAAIGGVILKHDTSGNFLWGRRYNSTGSNYSFMGVDVDAVSGNIYGVGRFYPGSTGLVVQYSPSGVLGWQRGLQGPAGTVDLHNVSVSPSGDVYCVGRAFLSGNFHQYVAKLDSTGNLMWQRTFGSAASDNAYCVAVDASGNAYVGGTNGSFTSTVCCFDPLGNVLWARTVGPGGVYAMRDVCLAGDGSLYFAGYGQPGGGGTSTLVAHLGSDGSLIKTSWWHNVSSYDNQWHLALAPDQSGYVTSYIGSALPPATLGILRFDAGLNITGEVHWSPSVSTDIGNGIACDATAFYVGHCSTNNSGTWSSISGTYSTGSGISATAFAPTMHSTAGPVVTLSGSSVSLSGTVDTGGGMSDFFLARRTMP